MMGVEQPNNVETKISLKPYDIHVCAMENLNRQIIVLETPAIQTYLKDFWVCKDLIEHL